MDLRRSLFFCHSVSIYMNELQGFGKERRSPGAGDERIAVPSWAKPCDVVPSWCNDPKCCGATLGEGAADMAVCFLQ